MSLGARLREERQRLGLNQTDFAALAGASKRAMVSWEKDDSAPIATALLAWADAGADAVYILTGRRTVDREDNPATQIEEQLAAIRRDMLIVADAAVPWEDAGKVDQERLRKHANALAAMLRFDGAFLTPDLREEAESLQAMVNSPVQLAAFRAADHVQLRAKRREMKARLAEWYDGSSYQPADTVANILVEMAMTYGVPVKLLAELVDEIGHDIEAKSS